MSAPQKVIIEITGREFSHKVIDENGVILFEDCHEMESSGQSRSKSDDVWESGFGDEFPSLADAIDDLSFGPFGIAGVLYNN